MSKDRVARNQTLLAHGLSPRDTDDDESVDLGATSEDETDDEEVLADAGDEYDDKVVDDQECEVDTGDDTDEDFDPNAGQTDDDVDMIGDAVVKDDVSDDCDSQDGDDVDDDSACDDAMPKKPDADKAEDEAPPVEVSDRLTCALPADDDKITRAKSAEPPSITKVQGNLKKDVIDRDDHSPLRPKTAQHHNDEGVRSKKQRIESKNEIASTENRSIRPKNKRIAKASVRSAKSAHVTVKPDSVRREVSVGVSAAQTPGDRGDPADIYEFDCATMHITPVKANKAVVDAADCLLEDDEVILNRKYNASMYDLCVEQRDDPIAKQKHTPEKLTVVEKLFVVDLDAVNPWRKDGGDNKKTQEPARNYVFHLYRTLRQCTGLQQHCFCEYADYAQSRNCLVWNHLMDSLVAKMSLDADLSKVMRDFVSDANYYDISAGNMQIELPSNSVQLKLHVNVTRILQEYMQYVSLTLINEDGAQLNGVDDDRVTRVLEQVASMHVKIAQADKHTTVPVVRTALKYKERENGKGQRLCGDYGMYLGKPISVKRTLTLTQRDAFFLGQLMLANDIVNGATYDHVEEDREDTLSKLCGALTFLTAVYQP